MFFFFYFYCVFILFSELAIAKKVVNNCFSEVKKNLFFEIFICFQQISLFSLKQITTENQTVSQNCVQPIDSNENE